MTVAQLNQMNAAVHPIIRESNPNRIIILGGVVWSILVEPNDRFHQNEWPIVYLKVQLALFWAMQTFWGVGFLHMVVTQLTTGSFKDHFHDSDVNHSKDGGVSSKGGDAKVGPGGENTRQRTGGAK